MMVLSRVAPLFVKKDIHRANMIRELLQARDGQLDISMSPCDVRTLLEYVCTM